MRLAKGLIIGAWFLVGINLLMAFGAIGIFMRMTPAIADIITKNERSLQACEGMLATLSLAREKNANLGELRKEFITALERANKNITEKEEPIALEKINKNYKQAFSGDLDALRLTVQATLDLGDINRTAMAYADRNAQQLGKGGAWGIVFMAICSFMVGVVFIRNLSQKLLDPLEEIKTVLLAHQNGETRRRCTGANLPPDIRAIYGSINNVLDRSLNNSFKDDEKIEKITKQ